MQSQDIALRLVASLDQGSIASDASNMSKTLQTAIESAFEGLGERIAKKILSDLGGAIQQGIGSAIGSIQVGGPTQTAQQIASSRIDQDKTTILDYSKGSRGPIPEIMGDDVVKQIPRPGASTEETEAPGEQAQSRAEKLLSFMKENKRQISAFGAGLSAVAEVVGTVFGDMPGISRRSEASRAEMTGMSGRQMMRGQFEDMFAQQSVGGVDEMKSRARGEEVSKGIASGVMTAIKDIGMGAGIGSMAAGPFGALVGGGAGVVKAGVDIFKQYQGFDSSVEQNVAGQTEAERKRNAEFLAASSRGRNTGVSAYQTAQGMGSESLTGFLTGDRFRTLSSSLGLSEQTLQGGLQGFAGMGGVFQGHSNLDDQTGSVRRLIGQMSQGFLQAPQAAQGLVAGGADQGNALETTANMFEDAVAAGMDKAKVGDAMMRMASRSEQLGLGGAEFSKFQESQSIAEAQKNFGTKVQDSQLKSQEDAINFMNQRSTQGLEYTGAIRGIRSLERQFGGLKGQSGNMLESALATHQETGTGLAALLANPDFKKSGLDEMINKMVPMKEGMTRDKQLEEAATRFNQSAAGGAQGMFNTGLGREMGQFARGSAFAPAGTTLDQFALGYGTAGDIGKIGKALPVQGPEQQLDNQSENIKKAQMLQAATDAQAINVGLGSLAQQIPLMARAFSNFIKALDQQSSRGFRPTPMHEVIPPNYADAKGRPPGE